MATVTGDVRIGIDLGGTKIEGIAIDAVGNDLCRLRIPTPRSDYASIVGSIKHVVDRIESTIGATTTVGVGIPGSVSPTTGLVRNANTTCLIGKPFDRDLTRALGRSVRVDNDANCFTISEATDGAGRGAESVFGVILGTGTGGGVVVHGRLLGGSNGVAGEWGHNPLPWPRPDELPGPACYCGKHGCIETFLSGPGLASDHAAHRGGQWTGRDVALAAAQGDEAARATMSRYYDRLARGLATIVNVLDPEVIVLGGGLSQVASLYEEVPARWGAYVFSDAVRTRLAPPVHGDSSGVRGAAWLWPSA